MQVITRGQSNTCVFTLKEKQTLTSPYFLFELTSKGDTYPYTFIAADTSSYTDRYNRFTIQEVTGTITPVNRLAGIIQLNQNGEYAYRVFEQTSSTNLSTANADNQTPVEEGLITVQGTGTTTTYYTPTHADGKVYKSGR